MGADRIARTARLPELDDRPVARRIGLVALATDHTTERDFARMLPHGEAAVYVSRVAYDNPTTPENLARMGPRLGAAAALILPGEPLDALYYGCTAASFVMGDRAVAAAFASAKPDVPVVTPPQAAVLAFRALGIRRIAILTPYLEETSRPLIPYLEERGLEVTGLTCFGMEDDREMARIKPSELVRAAVEAAGDGAEGLFISCTALRSTEVVGEIERRLGRPAVTSNQAGIWCSMRQAGIASAIDGYGRLLGLPLPDTAGPGR
ncbi:ectoine utilization protein EutA [Oceanibacterium hippocampi]|uniref:Arylmalonate decarboxylase n=1 Tax=Oceanibacterium hippocampi TaxID=745714 RepID=A0A1Y5TES4_9PROT|nr:ectoine utilization protein EutA [Oceanibacterium hippocampi]SLN62206.1 Arylmalonate decarboxylase [Oceanibacterium hippocampi]